MRMMGADSVAYHAETVLERGDDHPGRALAYYASRGETPLVWGGSAAAGLGLAGAVTSDAYAALYGPGGARHPVSGERLAKTLRPGLELVIAAHKSVAELGVIGRAEDMHAIMDAEHDATLGYLDDLTRRGGGRRGRGRVATPTTGLIYATTRHATTRAGDPGPHDHVLVANVVEMADDRGGYKAADTTLWREHLHAATMVGRVAAARRAVELGYAIVADPGPSGRLGHWAIAGIPDAVVDLHSKRSTEIDDHLAGRGYGGYRARNIAARATRDVKRHTPLGELMPTWQAELEAVGYPVAELVASIDAAAAMRAPVMQSLPSSHLRGILDKTLDSDGELARRKVFARRDVVVAVGPALFGLPASELYRVVSRVLAHPGALPLVAVAGARERPYAVAQVVATEVAIAEVVERRGSRRDVAVLSVGQAVEAIWAAERKIAAPLTDGQRDAVAGICTSGAGVDLVLGIAGAGKTTALGAVRHAYEAAGYGVIGTSTSGQAARTLGSEADIVQSRTLASLLWRMDHSQLRLGPRHVVVCDEAGMTSDADVLRLLVAAEVAGSKVVLVGDDRQLGAVGSGGSFGALLGRHPDWVHQLTENVRQRDAGERQALAELRAGDVGTAVSWYADNGRIVAVPSRYEALDAVVAGWSADTSVGRDAAMYAWRRANVAELNRRARQRWSELGRLSGPELVAPGGLAYAAGDRIVTLAPSADGRLLTSERATVTAVDTEARILYASTDDGRNERLGSDDIGADRLAHGYAMTIHRSQGATVDTAHRYEDGGGRELAYVAMSRARHSAKAYVVVDNAAQAIEVLGREWSAERRVRWAIDRGISAPELAADQVAPPSPEAALRLGRLRAERDALAATIPADPIGEVIELNAKLSRLSQDRDDLQYGRGRYVGAAMGQAAADLIDAQSRRRSIEGYMGDPRMGWRMRRSWQREAQAWARREVAARQRCDRLVAPEMARLEADIDGLGKVVGALFETRSERENWRRTNPGVARSLDRLDVEIASVESDLGLAPIVDLDHHLSRGRAVGIERPTLGVVPEHDHGLGLGW